MNLRRIFSYLLLLGGEAIIIATFILFRGKMTDQILVLNIVATTFIYALFFVDVLVPWIDFKKPQRRVGMLGLRWFVTWFYSIFAVVAMIGFYFLDVKFSTQLVTHCILFFFMMLGMRLVLTAGDQVENVYVQETQNRSGINEMKAAMRNLRNKINTSNNLPADFSRQVNTLEENLRYISPSNNPDAYELEISFVGTVGEINLALSNYSLNEEQIQNNLKKLEHIYQTRKQIYSN